MKKMYRCNDETYIKLINYSIVGNCRMIIQCLYVLLCNWFILLTIKFIEILKPQPVCAYFYDIVMF